MSSFLSDWIPLREDDAHGFACSTGSGGGNPEAPTYVGDLLHQALIEVGYVQRLLSEHGEEAVSAYLASRGFIGKLSKRVGDLGEVLAGAVICDAESLVLPIQKLRYRERADWAMRLTDVFAVRFSEARVVDFCYTSVKSGMTRPRDTIALDGYKQLQEDAEVEHPQICHFVSAQLYRNQDYETLLAFDQALYSAEPVAKCYRLVLIFDESVWNDSLLDPLDEVEDLLPNFRAYVLTLKDLRSLCEQAYSHATGRCYVK